MAVLYHRTYSVIVRIYEHKDSEPALAGNGLQLYSFNDTEADTVVTLLRHSTHTLNSLRLVKECAGASAPPLGLLTVPKLNSKHVI